MMSRSAQRAIEILRASSANGSTWTISEVRDILRAADFERTYAAVRGYVEEALSARVLTEIFGSESGRSFRFRPLELNWQISALDNGGSELAVVDGEQREPIGRVIAIGGGEWAFVAAGEHGIGVMYPDQSLAAAALLQLEAYARSSCSALGPLSTWQDLRAALTHARDLFLKEARF